MYFSSVTIVLSVALSLFSLVSADSKRVTKQVGTLNGQVSSTKDHEAAAGSHHGFGLDHGHHGHGLGFGGGHDHGHHGHDGKYFQYAHNPDYGTYEYGYRRGSPYHFTERYEKAHDWNFKTKVKWGDKYGGYGEHYWDYQHTDKNYHGDHGGHDGGHGHGHGHDGGHHGHYSEPVEVYEATPKNSLNKRQSQSDKKEAKKSATKEKQTPSPSPNLSLDIVTGKVTDESSGKTYWLRPATEESEVKPTV